MRIRPPLRTYPGDDGIAMGYYTFSLFGKTSGRDSSTDSEEEEEAPSLWNETLSPYLGPMPTNDEMKEAIAWASPWLDGETIHDVDERNDMIVEEFASGGVVATYHGRIELGPRALGHRNILRASCASSTSS